jgi:hypothetical protein
MLAKLAAKAAMASAGLPSVEGAFIAENRQGWLHVKQRGRDVSRPYKHHTTSVRATGYILVEHFVTLWRQWR